MPTKKRTSSQRKRKLSLLGYCLISFFILLCAGYGWYQSRAIPELGEEQQMTVLPAALRNVLGAKIGRNASADISIRIPIFLYHYVEYVSNNPSKQNLNVTPDVLTSQIETLKNAGYTFITPSDLATALSGKSKLPPKVTILSFDDGYMDFYTYVFPILKKEHVKAVLYIVPNFLDRPDYLFTFELQEIAKNPLVEIGAHTMNHTALAGISKTAAANEITQSRKVLQTMLHLPINSFAYPYGSFDLQAIQLVKEAGFTNAVSVIPGIMQNPDTLYFLNRLRPGYRTGNELLTFLKQNTFQPW